MILFNRLVPSLQDKKDLENQDLELDEGQPQFYIKEASENQVVPEVAQPNQNEDEYDSDIQESFSDREFEDEDMEESDGEYFFQGDRD